MKLSNFTDAQKAFISKQGDERPTVAEIRGGRGNSDHLLR